MIWDTQQPTIKEDYFVIINDAAMKHMPSNFSKLDKFKGVDFRRWQKKMHFLLSGMSVVYVLTTPFPEDDGDDATMEQIRKRAKWDNDDYVCRGLILNDFKHTLKHLKEELTLVELGSHRRIEESLRVQDSDKPKGNNVAGLSVVNMVEHNNSSRDCKGVNVGNKANGLGTKGLVNGSSNSLKGQNMFNKSLQVYYVTYVSEAYFVHDDDVVWWVDSGPTVHVCKDRYWFKTYESLNDESILHMRNESTALVHERGCVDLRFSSRKIVSLVNVLHVPNIRKNLVSSSVLKIVVISKLNIINDNIASAFMSTSKLNDSIPWHARLGHVHFKRMQDVSKDGLISGLSQGFWSEAMLIAFYLLNMVPNKRNRITLYELGTKRKPNLNYLRVWGCRAVFYVPLSLIKSVSINSIIESRDVIFDENRFSSVPRLSLRIPNGTEDIGGLVVPEEVTKEVVQQPEPELRKSKRNRTPKNFRPEFQLYLIEGTRDEVSDQHSYCFNFEDDPKIFDEAMKSQDVAFWKEAINDEMDSIMGNKTWVFANLPPGYKPLGCKWIFKIKLKVDGTIEKFKAKLVIEGFKQKMTRCSLKSDAGVDGSRKRDFKKPSECGTRALVQDEPDLPEGSILSVSLFGKFQHVMHCEKENGFNKLPKEGYGYFSISSISSDSSEDSEGPAGQLILFDALRDRGIEARVVVEADDRDEAMRRVERPVEVRDEGYVILEIPGRHRMVGVDLAVIALNERIAELERDNRGLRGTMSVESQRVDRLQRSMSRGNGNGGNGGNGNGGNGGNGNGGNGNGGNGGNGNGGNEENGNRNRNMNHGTEGVVRLTRWFEKMETVFNISNCPLKYQAKYATCTLQDSALTWWNTHKRTLGVDAAYAMNWAGLMRLMTEVYFMRNEIQKMETEL
ncbi:zinc finger, CCHC-type containing protein [Tanacetum coccineum]